MSQAISTPGSSGHCRADALAQLDLMLVHVTVCPWQAHRTWRVQPHNFFHLDFCCSQMAVVNTPCKEQDFMIYSPTSNA